MDLHFSARQGGCNGIITEPRRQVHRRPYHGTAFGGSSRGPMSVLMSEMMPVDFKRSSRSLLAGSGARAYVGQLPDRRSRRPVWRRRPTGLGPAGRAAARADDSIPFATWSRSRLGGRRLCIRPTWGPRALAGHATDFETNAAADLWPKSRRLATSGSRSTRANRPEPVFPPGGRIVIQMVPLMRSLEDAEEMLEAAKQYLFVWRDNKVYASFVDGPPSERGGTDRSRDRGYRQRSKQILTMFHEQLVRRKPHGLKVGPCFNYEW